MVFRWIIERVCRYLHSDADVRVSGTRPTDQHDIFGFVDELAVAPDPDQGLVGGTVGELEAGQVAMCRSKMPHSVIHRAFSLETDVGGLQDSIMHSPAIRNERPLAGIN